MTIQSVRTISKPAPDTSVIKPPAKVYSAPDFPFKGYQEPQTEGYEQSKSTPSTSAIIIDNGAHNIKAGWSFDKTPRISFPPLMSKYRDRKLGRSCLYVGNDTYVDATTRGQQKNAFEPGSSVVGNWDAMEGVLDCVFVKLGVDGESGGIGRHVVMTEPLANLGYTRKTMNEILFECYSAPSVAYGIDSLFSYKYNGGKDGLVLSSSHTSTHVIPVLDSKPLLHNATRLNFGGQQAADFLMKLIKLKYPTFPTRLYDHQIEEYVREHCYVSQDYERELSNYLEWTGLEDRDRIIQYPFTEHVVVEKSEEELAKIAERKREGGRRLQEQAAKMRLDKLIQKERRLEYLKEMQEGLQEETKKEARRILDTEDFKDEAHLDRTIRELEKSIRKSRNKDLGNEEEPEEEQTFPLLEIPDDQLDEAGLKEKRHQRLMKSNVDARRRAKEEKEREKARVAEEERLEMEHRTNNFEDWAEQRHSARDELLQRIKERDRLKADLGNRKSLASQMRMKTLAGLASDGPKKRRRNAGNGNGDDDDFGANDDDWGVYRTVAIGENADSDDEEEDLEAQLTAVEAQLLQHDPNFTDSDTHAAQSQSSWTKSRVHAFLRGPWPFDPESQREAHQLHLNVERIRVPEVVFQPSIAGIDQAGITEICADVLLQRFGSDPVSQDKLLRDIFLTGGNSLFKGFQERLETELRAVLPSQAPIKIRRAKDARLDAWRGAAMWTGGSEWAGSRVSKEEYEEKGGEYLKEHSCSNMSLPSLF